MFITLQCRIVIAVPRYHFMTSAYCVLLIGVVLTGDWSKMVSLDIIEFRKYAGGSISFHLCPLSFSRVSLLLSMFFFSIAAAKFHR